MVTSLLSRLFGCRHRSLTRPITPAHKPGTRAEGAYVACLDCGKSFHYDVVNMRRGPQIPRTANTTSSNSKPFQSQY
ncbi:MAG TPA: hypothetical protein VGH38_32785 [Bryobacteraceae bacterium]|jgi:hypothetical protein